MHKQILVKFHRFVLKKLKRLSGNEILTSFKGHNSVVNLQKLMCNNPNLDLVNINAHARLGKFHQFVQKILSGNEILISFKGHNSVINLRTLTRNNPILDLVNINAYPKFGQMPSIVL